MNSTQLNSTGHCIHSSYKHSALVSHSSLSQSQSHIATDGQSVSQPVSLGARSCFCESPSLTRGCVCLLYICQRSFSRVRVPWDSRPYFTVSDLRLPFSSAPTTCRVTVEVFGPASTRVSSLSYNRYSLYKLHMDHIENIFHS
jgi:hypothetical protein